MFFYKNTLSNITIMLLMSIHGMAQIRLNSVNRKEELVDIFLKENKNIWIDSVSYEGASSSISSFNVNLDYCDFFESGIILSCGDVNDAKGPNKIERRENFSYKRAPELDKELARIATGPLYDIASLSFEFMANTDSISFSFFFASEEYPEYVNKNVSDVFGFFLIDKDSKECVNMAIIPNSKTPIAIDNINENTNSELYIQNGIWNQDNMLKWEHDLRGGELAYNFSFDGFTRNMKVGRKVIANNKYILKMVIADVGDDLFDSAVFLKANSFESVGYSDTIITKEPFTELFDQDQLEIEDSIIRVFLPVYFAFNSDSIQKDISYNLLNKIVKLMEYDLNLRLEITGHTDAVGSYDYNKTLSEKRAQRIADYLFKEGVGLNRMATYGEGYNKLKSNMNANENRRVEFAFSK